MDNNIKVSVIMPAYNAERYIELAINSVLKQSFQNFELIIINDGSNDETRHKILAFGDARIKLIENESNIGLQKSLNKGLSFSHGKYIARIDADDEWISNDKLQRQVNFLDENPEYVLVGTGATCIDSNGKYLYKYLKKESDREIREIIIGYNCFIHSSVVFRKESAMSTGMYPEDEKSKHVEDYSLWLKLGIIGKLHNLQSYDVNYRISEASISQKNKKEQLKKTIKIASQNKKYYPKNYFLNNLRNFARLFLYGYLKK